MPESDLGTLLATLSPARIAGEYVFASVTEVQFSRLAGEDVLGSFREAEGISVLVPLAVAQEHGFAYEGVYGGITLGVYSSLEAVGLTAAVAAALAAREIPANVIAACHHDHVFVPLQQLDDALGALAALTRRCDG
jgi:hypothetical protein